MSSETRGVKLAATKEGLTITSDNPDLGEVREELDAEYNGEPIAIGFNPKYVVELLGQMDGDQITIALGGELDPGLVRPLSGDELSRRRDADANLNARQRSRCVSYARHVQRASFAISAASQLEPRERFNVFVGENGQGKTNLLEAIYVVATLRSFRTAASRDLIAFEARDAPRATAAHASSESSARADLPGRARARAPARACSTARPCAPSRYFGGFNVVVFTPEDLALPRGAPGDRRQVPRPRGVQSGPEYLVAIQDYEKVLKQRNTVLAGRGRDRDARVERCSTSTTTSSHSSAVRVVNARAAFVDELRRQARGRVRRIDAHRARAGVATCRTPAWPRRAIARASERRRARATSRPGRRRAGRIAMTSRSSSTGTRRGRLRIAGPAPRDHARVEDRRARAAREDARRLPILLLDDVSSELDPSRNEYLFEHLAQRAGQCFITTTHGARPADPTIVRISASKMARFPRDPDPFLREVRMCYNASASAP